MHHRGLDQTAALGGQHQEGEFQHAATLGGPAEKIKLFCLGIVEAVSSTFALIDEVFIRTGFGRRYFSLLGIGTAYYLTLIIYYLGSFILYLRTNASSLKPSLVIDPLAMQRPATEVATETTISSDTTFFFMLQLFVVVALTQKALTYWRKIMHREAAFTVYGGDSVFGCLLKYVPEWWILHLAVNKDDFVKRYVDPACCYALGGWVITPFMDASGLTGALVQWSAIAMFIRGTCIRIRFQLDLDNTMDSQEKVRHLFEKLDDNRGNNDAPVRIQLH